MSATTAKPRPKLVTALVIIQWLSAAAYLAASGYLVYLTRSPDTLKLKNPGAIVQGLFIGAEVLLVPAVCFALAAWMLARGWRSGWILAVLTNLTVVLLFFEEPMFEHARWFSEDTVFAWPSLIVTVLLLLPPVFRYVFRSHPHGSETRATQVS